MKWVSLWYKIYGYQLRITILNNFVKNTTRMRILMRSEGQTRPNPPLSKGYAAGGHCVAEYGIYIYTYTCAHACTHTHPHTPKMYHTSHGLEMVV